MKIKKLNETLDQLTNLDNELKNKVNINIKRATFLRAFFKRGVFAIILRKRRVQRIKINKN